MNVSQVNETFAGPIHVDFNLTNACNLACHHCHASSGSRLSNEIGLAEVFRVIDELHALGVLSIAFAGGEPFMVQHIFEILQHACNLPGWSVSVITNGLFFKPGMLEQLDDKCPNLRINISLEGSSPSRFAFLRRQKSRKNADPFPLFEKVVEGVRQSAATSLYTSVNMTVTRGTIDDVLPTYNFVINELEADALVAIKFFPSGHGKKNIELLENSYHIWSNSFANWTQHKLHGDYPFLQISIPAAWEFYLPLIEADLDIEAAEYIWGYRSSLREAFVSSQRTISDVAGFAEFCINADGKIYPSILLGGVPSMECGDIREKSLLSFA